jgi:hypothetical protein
MSDIAKETDAVYVAEEEEVVRLPSLTKLAPIFFTRHYALLLVINVVLTIIVNGLIDYFTQKGKAAHYLVEDTTVLTTCIFALIMGLIYFASSGDIHKRIKKGVCAPVTRQALRDNVFKKVFFFAMQEPNWKKRFPMFMWQSALIPGVLCYVCIFLFCWMSIGFASMEHNECKTSLAVFVVWTEVWKSICVTIIFTANYAAAHNEEQKEIQVSLVGSIEQGQLDARA